MPVRTRALHNPLNLLGAYTCGQRAYHRKYRSHGSPPNLTTLRLHYRDPRAPNRSCGNPDCQHVEDHETDMRASRRERNIPGAVILNVPLQLLHCKTCCSHAYQNDGAMRSASKCSKPERHARSSPGTLCSNCFEPKKNGQPCRAKLFGPKRRYTEDDVCEDCKDPGKKVVTDGRCQQCYNRARRSPKTARSRRYTKKDVCKECKIPKNKIIAAGLCNACYLRRLRAR